MSRQTWGTVGGSKGHRRPMSAFAAYYCTEISGTSKTTYKSFVMLNSFRISSGCLPFGSNVNGKKKVGIDGQRVCR